MDPRALVALLVLLAPACSTGDSEPLVVDMKLTDALRFDPDEVYATRGSRVTFRLVNTGTTDHELVIGDADFHTAHRAAMESGHTHAGHSHGGGAGKGDAVHVGPGESATLTFTMPSGDPPSFACYVNGHAAAGMVGRVFFD